jgi:hypothetical protein
MRNEINQISDNVVKVMERREEIQAVKNRIKRQYRDETVKDKLDLELLDVIVNDLALAERLYGEMNQFISMMQTAVVGLDTINHYKNELIKRYPKDQNDT